MVQEGAAAPKFKLRDLDGREHSLEQMLQRGSVLLAFFKISCPVCQLAFPFLERMKDQQRVQIVGIAQDNASAAGGFAEEFGVTFPVLIDSHGYPVSNAYAISQVPTMFEIGADGTIAHAWSGFSKADMEALGERTGIPPFGATDNVPQWKAG